MFVSVDETEPSPPQWGLPNNQTLDRPEKRRRAEEHLRGRSAFRNDRFCEAVIVDSDLTKVKEERSHDIACICRQLVGRYFKVGMVEGSPVYRQELCVYTHGTDRDALIRHTHGA